MRSTLLMKREGRVGQDKEGWVEVRRVVERVWGIAEDLRETSR